MRFYRNLAFASVSLLSLASAPAFAQGAEPGNDSSLGEGGGDIVVTARRRDESAQDVPLVVNAVTSESLSKLNIRDFRDVQAVVPGLQLTPAPNGSQSNASLRGLNNDVTAAGFNGTVQFYFNDAPIALSTLLTSMYDIGQIEVLRGPQGTLRGRAAPSGSITVTSRRPDLNEIGGYVNMTGQTHGAINVNAGVGVPIIKDVLAIRVAGLFDQNGSTRINSINNGVKPWSQTSGERISVRFDPIDTLSINASFSNVIRDGRDYQQVESANLATGTALPAGSRLITAEDRLSAGAIPQPVHSHFKIWDWSADWRVAGQRLVYVGSHATSSFVSFAPSDAANAYAGLPDAVRFSGQQTNSLSTEQSHELRLQSDERLFGMFDYILGGFWYKTEPNTELVQQTPLFIGLSQNTATFVPTAANFQSINRTPVSRLSDSLEKSIFFNLTAHFGERTELSAGGRYINYKANNRTIAPTQGLNRNDPVADDQWIYTASLKHRFSDTFMAYASVGSSWRPGSSTNGVIDTNFAPSPIERALQGPQPSETSTSYEIGFKSDLFDRRVRFNVSAFHQDFNNFIYFAPNIYVAYTDGTGAQTARQLSGLATGVPAKVDGIEAELAFKVSSRFNLSASATYAKSKIKNGVVPCNLAGYGATPTAASILAATGGQTVGTCTVNFSAARTAPFSATVQGEYIAPVSGDIDGFVRGLLTINGRSQGDPTNPYDTVDAYALANLYAGIRSSDGSWEVSLFAKNLFDTQRVLTRNATAAGAGYTQLTCTQQVPACNGQNTTFGGNLFTNYRAITTTQPREFGLNVRYAFGSR